MEIASPPTLDALEQRLRHPRRCLTSVRINGVKIRDLFAVGARVWFEYHCWESPESSDAEIWYRSHQQVTVLGFAKGETPAFTTFIERAEACVQLVYRVRFDDGLEWDVFEDELLLNPANFCRPDPPKRPTGDTYASRTT